MRHWCGKMEEKRSRKVCRREVVLGLNMPPLWRCCMSSCNQNYYHPSFNLYALRLLLIHLAFSFSSLVSLSSWASSLGTCIWGWWGICSTSCSSSSISYFSCTTILNAAWYCHGWFCPTCYVLSMFHFPFWYVYSGLLVQKLLVLMIGSKLFELYQAD